MVKTCELGVCENDPKYTDTPVIPPLPEEGGGGGGGGDGHKYTFSSTGTGWQVAEDGRVIYRYTDKDTDTTYAWQTTTEGWIVKDNTGKVVFTYTDKSGENTTYSFEKKDDCGFKVTDSDGVVVFDYDNDCAGTTYTYEQTGVDFKVTDNNTGQVVFTYKGTVDTNTTYTWENYKDGFKVTDSDGVVAYIYDPNLGKDSDGSYAIDTLLTTVFKGHTTISTGQIVGFTPANLVVGETLVYDGVGTVGVITADNGDGTYQVTTMTTAPGSRQGVRLGSVNTEADLPATCAAAEALGWQTPQLGDFAYVTTGGAGDVISEYVITNDTDCNLTWTFSHSFNAGDYQEQSTTSMSGMILTGGAVQGTFGTPIDPKTLIRGVKRNGILLTPDAQGKVNVIVDDSHIIVNALPTTNIVDKAEYVVIDANQKVTGTWVHDATGWYQTYAAVTQVKAHQVVTALPTTGIEENVEYVVVDNANKVTGTWVYDPTKGWLQTEVMDKPAHIVVKDLPTTDIDDEAEYVQVGDLTDPVNTFVATWVHTAKGWVKTAEASTATQAHIAVTALPTTGINENAEYLVMTDLTDPTTLTGTWVRVKGNWVQTERLDDNGYHIVTALPTSDIDDKNVYIVVEDLTNPDTTFLGQYAYDKATSKWVDMTPQVSNIYYNINRDGQELLSAHGMVEESNPALANGLVRFKKVSGTINQPAVGMFTVPAGKRVTLMATLSHRSTSGALDYSAYFCNADTSTMLPNSPSADPYAVSGYVLTGTIEMQWTNDTGKPVNVGVMIDNIHGGSGTLYNQYSSFTIQEIGRVVDPVAYLDNDGNAEDMPVGSLLNHFGTTAPKHYVVADGQEYAIGTYPALEAFFLENFGAVNHFGGNGTTTWAVPDLQGEFLRAAGTNSHTNTITGLKEGSGAAVGEHQGASVLPYNWSGTGAEVCPINYIQNKNANADSRKAYYNAGTNNWDSTNTYTNTTGEQTTRPTNTSVLVCIKCEPTPRVVIDQGTYKATADLKYVLSNSAMAQPKLTAVQDDTTCVKNSSYGDGQAFVAPVDGYYAYSFMLPEPPDISNLKYHATYIYRNNDLIGGEDRDDGSDDLRVPMNTSGLVKLKAGDELQVRFYLGWEDSSVTSITRTGSASFALVNTVTDHKVAEMMLKPNLWTPGVEQSFGDGVYGYRVQIASLTTTPATGSNATALAPVLPASLKAKHVLDWGGTYLNSNNYFWSIPGSYTGGEHILYISNHTGAPNGNDEWSITITRTAAGTMRNFDIWVLYTKD